MGRSARFYDVLYEAKKDYAQDMPKLDQLIQQYKRSSGASLLDVACGTGQHLRLLRDHYEVEGLDLDFDMLAAARARLPKVPLHQADLVDFDLGRTFDVVTCLFSSIGYARTLPRLRRAIRTMGRHLRPGGVLIVEPWLSPETYRSDIVHAEFVDRPDLKVARMNVSAVRGRASVLKFHYLVATASGVERFSERHVLGLFRPAEYLEAFRSAGLRVSQPPVDLSGRGLYVGVAPCSNASEWRRSSGGLG